MKPIMISQEQLIKLHDIIAMVERHDCDHLISTNDKDVTLRTLYNIRNKGVSK